MFKRAVITICLLFTFPLAAQPLTYGYIGNAQAPPFRWGIEGDKTAYGYNIILIDNVSQALGFTLEYKAYQFESSKQITGIIDNLKRGVVDVATLPKQTFVSNDNITIVDYPVYILDIRVFIRQKKAFPVRQWSDLKDKKGAFYAVDKEFLIGGSSEFHHFAVNELDLRRASSFGDLLQWLISGQVDYIFGVYRPLLLEARKQNIQRQLVSPELIINRIPIHLWVSNLSPLKARVDDVAALIESYDKEGRLALFSRQAMQEYINLRR